MSKALWVSCAAALLFLPSAVAAQSAMPPPATAAVDYEKDVKPLLAQNCYACHGAEAQQSGLRLDLRQNALRGGDYGPVIIPGKSAESKIIKRLVDGDGGMRMPPSGPLTPEEIGVLRAWIDQGAEFRTEIADEAPPKPLDPRLAALIATVRSAATPRAAIERLIADNRALLTQTDPAGSTLLHHAAGFGSLETMTLLLDAGLDVNATNRRRSTPLHWAVTDEAKTRLLLARGAAVDARQVEGRTPLYVATQTGDGLAVVRLLLEKGANPNLASANGTTPLMNAAVRGEIAIVAALLDAKADVNTKSGAGDTALMAAATNGDPAVVRLLLDRGADARIRSKRNETALGNAGTAGNAETIRLLLDRGAEVNVRNIRGYSPLMLAASSDAIPADGVKLLLSHGAETSFTGDYDETARDLAAKRGDTALSRLLGASVPAPAPVALSPARRLSSDAVEKPLAQLEKQSFNFIRIAGCNSCHSQDLASAAAGFARSRGLRAPREIPQLPASMMAPPERLMDLNVVGAIGIAWELFDSGMNGVPRNAYTDAAARLIRASQRAAGNWVENEGRRPPMNAGEPQAAALAIYAMRQYGPAGDEAATAQSIRRAVTWLESARVEDTQDRAFQLLGLAWGKGSPEIIRRAVAALAATQRADGGWSQMPTLASDAYATGEALFALATAGGMSPSDPVYQKGVDFLLRTQAADGTWRVKTRSIWLQPYFESGFPYGQDQFISAAGTAWASMALAAAIPATPGTTTARR
jgi:ankyrin repeat protein